MAHELLDSLRSRLCPIGLNLIGVTTPETYDRDVPPARHLSKRWPRGKSIIVIGNGGRAFWDEFRRQRPAPAPLETPAHPLDAYTEHCVETLILPLLAPFHVAVVYPHQFANDPVSFLHLAACAGLGSRSVLGVLIHPEYGPWFALRTALVVDVALPVSPSPDFDPCPRCPRPCVPACPAGSVTASGWNIPLCTSHRVSRDDCGDGCYARAACVYGREHYYPLEAQRHHQRWALEAVVSRQWSVISPPAKPQPPTPDP